MEKNKTVLAGPVRILCAANAAYAGPLCVMLVSLLINFARNRKIEIYVLTTDIPGEDRRKIEASLCRNRPDFDPASLHWLSPDMEMFHGLGLERGSKLEVYARILAPRVLPENFDKILYLDSDMVILSDVAPLYDSPDDDSAVHAVRDEMVGNVSEPGGVFNYQDLGIPPETHYFNSGVLLIDLRLWREQKIADRTIEYLKKHGTSVWLWDQGGLNAILYNSWTEIDPTWNQVHFILNPLRWKQLGRSMTDWKRTKDHPRIVHYTGSDKPWINDRFPRYSYFFKYLAMTEYRNAFKGPWLERIIGFRLNYYLYRLHTFLFWKRSPQDILRVLKRMALPGANS
jgi:lipopolysaccharide biosynthesis glycosyltransferase